MPVAASLIVAGLQVLRCIIDALCLWRSMGLVCVAETLIA
jgi:hypothetical protein